VKHYITSIGNNIPVGMNKEFRSVAKWFENMEDSDEQD